MASNLTIAYGELVEKSKHNRITEAESQRHSMAEEANKRQEIENTYALGSIAAEQKDRELTQKDRSLDQSDTKLAQDYDLGIRRIDVDQQKADAASVQASAAAQNAITNSATLEQTKVRDAGTIAHYEAQDKIAANKLVIDGITATANATANLVDAFIPG